VYSCTTGPVRRLLLPAPPAAGRACCPDSVALLLLLQKGATLRRSTMNTPKLLPLQQHPSARGWPSL
jgi:hypothetical protein